MNKKRKKGRQLSSMKHEKLKLRKINSVRENITKLRSWIGAAKRLIL